MELINLNGSQIHKLKPAINKVGGRFTLTEKIKLKGVGISGLQYFSGLPNLEKENYQKQKLQVTLELYRQGIGFYLRNHEINFATVLPIQEISKISISKKEDTILKGESIFYKTAQKFTSDYLVARNFLLETEKLDFHPILCEFECHFTENLCLEISALRPQKVIDFFKKMENLQIEIDIKNHKISNG